MTEQKPSYGSTLGLTVAIYFFWGFAASANTLLIPLVKTEFSLSQFQAQLIEFSFYTAYFSGALLCLLANLFNLKWLASISTKSNMLVGLSISILGTFFLIFALDKGSFMSILTGLFIIAFGFALQQISANPILVRLGGKEYGAHRLTLAGALGSTGNMIAPLVLGHFVFSGLAEGAKVDLSSMAPIYYMLIVGYAVFILGYYVFQVPDLNSESHSGALGELLKNTRFSFGALALFCYVGAEVTLQSNLPELIKDPNFLGLPDSQISQYLSLFGGGLLLSRCAAAMFNFRLPKTLLVTLLFAVPLMAYGVVLIVHQLFKTEAETHFNYNLLGFIPFIVLFSIGLIISRADPKRMLIVFALAATVLLLLAVNTNGYLSMFSILAVALCSAVMWPCIFAIAVEEVESNSQLASAILIMMILGGGLIPPLQGLLSDISWIGIHRSYMLPMISYIVISLYAFTAVKAIYLKAPSPQTH